MNKIITISREFGSGGRELGRRLSETLEIAYYDQEIISEIAKRTSLSEKYVQAVIDHKPLFPFPIHIGRSFQPSIDPAFEQTMEIYREQGNIIQDMASKSDCVIVGRCADYILRDRNPLRLFVYADIQSKVDRCRTKAPAGENLTDAQLKRQIKIVDKKRARYYELYTGRLWGDKLNFDFCINTTQKIIKELIPAIAKLF